jgi:hypothetical protein
MTYDTDFPRYAAVVAEIGAVVRAESERQARAAAQAEARASASVQRATAYVRDVRQLKTDTASAARYAATRAAELGVAADPEVASAAHGSVPALRLMLDNAYQEFNQVAVQLVASRERAQQYRQDKLYRVGSGFLLVLCCYLTYRGDFLASFLDKIGSSFFYSLLLAGVMGFNYYLTKSWQRIFFQGLIFSPFIWFFGLIGSRYFAVISLSAACFIIGKKSRKTTEGKTRHV